MRAGQHQACVCLFSVESRSHLAAAGTMWAYEWVQDAGRRQGHQALQSSSSLSHTLQIYMTTAVPL